MSYPQYEPYPSVPAPTPGGGTAITAGVLASVGSAGQLLGGGFNIVLGLTDLGGDLAEYDSTGLFAQSWFRTYLLVTGSIAVISAFLLGVGAVMMFTRRPLGRVLVVAGCAVVIVAGIAGYTVTLHYTTSGGSAAEIGGGIGGLFGLIFPIATAVLALVPATTRWLNYSPVAAPVATYPYVPGSPPARYSSGRGVPSAGYPSGPGVPPSAYPSGPGVSSAGYPSGPGVSSAGYQPEPEVPPSAYPSGPGVPSVGYQSGPGVPPSAYPSGPGVPSVGYQPGPGVPPSAYPSTPAMPPAEYPSGPTLYPPSTNPQDGPSAEDPAAQLNPQPGHPGTDQAGPQPQRGANPQAAPDSPAPDLLKRQSDPTSQAEDSPWRRPPSQ
ncbi:hypothetical protein ACIBG0_28550 [Nocardia sp. NPDC050630]|uniref:hypothetical protein n=1 Tax=Nocardia sp. NPDC050630 TaxID=3364321 RepID=UPI00379217B5